MPSFFTKELTTKYQPLPEAPSGNESLSQNPCCQKCNSRLRSSRFLVTTILMIVGSSILINGVWIYQCHQVNSSNNCKSDFAQLSPEIPLPFTEIQMPNTTPDEQWELQNTDVGLVALSDDYVADKRLPHAQRWPWDESKGIYFLHGYHTLHCLKMIRNSILEHRNNSLQTQHWLHIDHCLTELRHDILCNADDSPRYTGGQFKQLGSGQGQMRLCRNWDKLDKWANQHSACFQTPENLWENTSSRERYKSCPDGSKPWKAFEGEPKVH